MTVRPLTETDVVDQVTEAFGKCNPPISFGSIEDGDFVDYGRFVALIHCLRDGDGTLDSKPKSPFPAKRDEFLTNLLKMIRGQRDLPDVSYQRIRQADKGQTLKLLQWILMVLTPVQAVGRLLPVHLDWMKNKLGIIFEEDEPARALELVAERFQLHDEPFVAFRRAGIKVPDDARGALVAVFNAAGRLGPDEIRFVLKPEIEAELSRILNELDRASISEVLSLTAALDTLTASLDGVKMTKALADQTQTTVRSARERLRAIQMRIGSVDGNQPARHLAFLEAQIDATKNAIAAVAEKARTGIWDDISELKQWMGQLNLENEARRVKEIITDSICPPAQKKSLQKLLEEANRTVSDQRESAAQRLEERIAALLSRHSELHTTIQSMLLGVKSVVDEGNGEFYPRIALLHDQDRVLFSISDFIHECSRLEKELRQGAIADFNTIAGFEVQRRQLADEIKAALRYEQRVKSFIEATKNFCGFYSAQLASLVPSHLGVVQNDFSILVVIRDCLTSKLTDIRNFWAPLSELRVIPGQDLIDSMEGWIRGLVARCDDTPNVVKAKILMLEAEQMSSFLSLVEECRSAPNDAETQFRALPDEAAPRFELLGAIVARLRTLNRQLDQACWVCANYVTSQSIPAEVIEFIQAFHCSRKPYEDEHNRLRAYLNAIRRFEYAAREVRATISRYSSSSYDDLLLHSSLALERLRETLLMCRQRIHSTRTTILLDLDNAMALISEEVSTALQWARSQNSERPRDRSPPLPQPQFGFARPHLVLSINRDTQIEDFVAFSEQHSTDYSGENITVQFIGELGIDAGGLTREVMAIVSNPIFTRAFTPTTNGDLLWLPANETCDSDRRKYLRAAGFLIRWAVEKHESIRGFFPLAVFRALTGEPMTFEDFRVINPKAAQSLIELRGYYASGGTPCVFLNDGRDVTQSLLPVYEAEQISLMMVEVVSEARAEFQRGFHGKVKSAWLARSSAAALHAHIVAPATVNWSEMQEKCRLKEYEPNDPTVVLFWKVFTELPEADKLRMLMFITGNDHPPASGFTNIPILIRKQEWNPETRPPLPTSATCFRWLNLPNYTDENIMRWAITFCAENCLGYGNH
jgi:hypothetical protein